MDHEQAELHTPPLNKIGLPDGYDEWRFREAIQELIQKCGGNPLFARGIAMDIVKEETEQRR